jgi:hypothetical protein
LNSTIVERVEKWYSKHFESRPKSYSQLFIRSNEASDSVHGKVEIGIETPSTVASITFWNRGAVMVLAVDKQLKQDLILDDRNLQSDENVESLLDGYLRKLTSAGASHNRL